MRITKNEIEFINKTIKSFLDCEIYLFGSRVNDNLKGGGDVDLIFSKNKNRDIEREALQGIKIG